MRNVLETTEPEEVNGVLDALEAAGIPADFHLVRRVLVADTHADQALEIVLKYRTQLNQGLAIVPISQGATDVSTEAQGQHAA